MAPRAPGRGASTIGGVMNKNWLIVGAVFGCFSGAALGACGQSGGTGTGGGVNAGGAASYSPSSSASSPASSSSGMCGASTSNGSSSASGADGGDAGMCSPPSMLFPPATDAGTVTLYCPFSGADGGKAIYCDTATQHCCEPKMGQSSCVPAAMPCKAGDTDWQCEDPIECPQGQVCCGTGNLMKNADPNCANTAANFSGTHCAPSCAGNEIIMCTSDAECSGGMTCLPFRARGNQVGGCY